VCERMCKHVQPGVIVGIQICKHDLKRLSKYV
jgi:hypothetical protein